MHNRTLLNSDSGVEVEGNEVYDICRAQALHHHHRKIWPEGDLRPPFLGHRRDLVLWHNPVDGFTTSLVQSLS